MKSVIADAFLFFGIRTPLHVKTFAEPTWSAWSSITIPQLSIGCHHGDVIHVACAINWIVHWWYTFGTRFPLTKMASLLSPTPSTGQNLQWLWRFPSMWCGCVCVWCVTEWSLGQPWIHVVLVTCERCFEVLSLVVEVLSWKYFSVTDGGRCEAKLTRTMKFTEKPITQVLCSINVPETSFTPLSPPHACHLIIPLSTPHTLVTSSCLSPHHTLVNSSHPCHLTPLSPHTLVTSLHPCHLLIPLSPPHILVTSSYPCHLTLLSPHHYSCHLHTPLSPPHTLVTSSHPCHVTPLSPPHIHVTSSHPCHLTPLSPPYTLVTSLYPCHLLTSLSPPHTLVTSHYCHLIITLVTSTHPCHLHTPLSPPHTLVTSHPCHLLTSMSPPHILVTSSHPCHLLIPL